MSCKYKSYHEKCTSPYCKVTNGECQFVKDAYDDVCSIRAAYLGDPGSSDSGSSVKEETKEEKTTFKTKFKNLFRRR